MDQHRSGANLHYLPTEILVGLLDPFPSQDLVPLALISHRFYEVILRILHHRLLSATTLKERKLILECYLPSCANTELPILCTHLSTEKLHNNPGENDELSLCESPGLVDSLGGLEGLYSRFKLERSKEGSLTIKRRTHSTMVSGEGQGAGDNGNNPMSTAKEIQNQRVRYIVPLDSFESFSQLCVLLRLVDGNSFPVGMKLTDGVVRLWQDWLVRQAHSTREVENAGDWDICSTSSNTDPEKITGNGNNENNPFGRHSVTWVDRNMDFGLKMRVRNIDEKAPGTEDISQVYDVEIEELVIRTTRLLFAIETAMAEEKNECHKTVIFGTLLAA